MIASFNTALCWSDAAGVAHEIEATVSYDTAADCKVVGIVPHDARETVPGHFMTDEDLRASCVEQAA